MSPPIMPKTSKLTGQQEIFCREYVACGVAVTAYRRAYRVKDTAKPETHYEQASKYLADPKIRTRIEEMQEKLAEVKVGELVNRLRIAADIGAEDRSVSGITGATMALGRLKGYFKDDPAKAGDIHIHVDALLKGVL